MRSRGLVIAIDGPSGAGKSTVGRALADRLGYVFVDTGAMYRGLALKALRHGLPLGDGAALAALLRETRLTLLPGGAVRLDAEDVGAQIRSREVSAAASQVSVHSAVRREMVERQRELGRDGGVVMDGRDIGTAVYPDAELKLYLDAAPSRRAARRCAELQAAGRQADLAAIEREIRERDRLDTTRSDSPLVLAPDALRIDTTELAPEQVLARLLAIVQERLERD